MGRLINIIRLIIIFIFAIGYSLTNAQQSVPRFEHGECPFETKTTLEGVDCGELVVYENRKNPSEGTLHLAVSILRSLSDSPDPDPLVFLSGGPGGSSVTHTPSRADSDYWNRLRQKRDIVFYDQRGTGYSDPAFCPEMNVVFMTVQYQGLTPREIRNRMVSAAKDCYDEMQTQGLDFSAYNTATSARDLDDLRQVLGYDRWNLYGLSYGTRLALTAMRDHPAGIRSVILDSSVPPNVRNLANRSSNFNRSLQMVFEQCATDPDCRNVYPDLKSNFYAIIDKLKHQPVEFSMKDTTKFPGGRLVLNDALLLGGMFNGFYNRNFIPLIPLLVQQTESGNFEVWRVLADQLARDPNVMSRGLNLSIRCHDNVPFNPKVLMDTARAQYPRLAPFLEAFYQYNAICDAWHKARADSIEFRPVRSDLPALILGGEFDPTTPTYYGKKTANTLSNSTFVKVPALGHGVAPFTECTRDLVNTFLDAPSEPLDTSCVADLPPVSFVTDVHINSGIYPLAQQIQGGPSLSFITIFGLMGLFLLSGLLVWPIRYIVKRLRGKTLESKGLQKVAMWFAVAASMAGLGFIIGLGFAIQNTISTNPFILAFGLIGSYSWIFLLPWILIFLTIVLLVFLFSAWRNKWWTLLHRIHYTFTTVTCLGLITFISFWKLW